MRILAISSAFPPDPAAVGQYMSEVAVWARRNGHHVVVLTADRGYEDPNARFDSYEVVEGVEIVRLRWSSLGKKSFIARVLGQVSFSIQGLIRGLACVRPDAILVSTTPPFSIATAWLLSILRNVPLTYWVMDINPDQAIAMNMVKRRSWSSLVMEMLNRRVILSANSVLTLDPFMAKTLSLKIRNRRPILVVPPWPHEEALGRSVQDREQFRAAYRLNGKFVIMYSGNHSWVHPLDTILNAAKKLADRKDVLFLFIGQGNEKAKVEKAIRDGAANVRSLPFQPLEQLGGSLSAADAHLVVMGDAMVGIVHPCKIYNAMMVDKPILAVAPDASHVATILDGHGAGFRVRHGDSDGLAQAIRSLADMSEAERSEMGRRAGALVRERWNQSELMGRFIGLLEGGGLGSNPRPEQGL